MLLPLGNLDSPVADGAENAARPGVAEVRRDLDVSVEMGVLQQRPPFRGRRRRSVVLVVQLVEQAMRQSNSCSERRTRSAYSLDVRDLVWIRPLPWARVLVVFF